MFRILKLIGLALAGALALLILALGGGDLLRHDARPREPLHAVSGPGTDDRR